MNNNDPELDLARRNVIALILNDLGNRTRPSSGTVVATTYGPRLQLDGS